MPPVTASQAGSGSHMGGTLSDVALAIAPPGRDHQECREQGEHQLGHQAQRLGRHLRHVGVRREARPPTPAAAAARPADPAGRRSPPAPSLRSPSRSGSRRRAARVPPPPIQLGSGRAPRRTPRRPRRRPRGSPAPSPSRSPRSSHAAPPSATTATAANDPDRVVAVASTSSVRPSRSSLPPCPDDGGDEAGDHDGDDGDERGDERLLQRARRHPDAPSACGRRRSRGPSRCRG